MGVFDTWCKRCILVATTKVSRFDTFPWGEHICVCLYCDCCHFVFLQNRRSAFQVCSWNSLMLFIPFSLYLVMETFTCSCGGTCVCVGWKWWHRSGQKALLTTLTDKPTTLKSWHTSHVLWHYVLPHLYCDLLKGSPFNKVCFPPFDSIWHLQCV